MIYAFHVDATPAVQGNHRIGRNGRIYEASSARLRDWREAVGWAARTVIRRGSPFEGPVRLKLAFRLRQAKAGPRTAYPMTRPDLDKLTRAVCDALTGIAYVDDGQIVELFVTKGWGPPGCGVEVIELVGVTCPVCGQALVDGWDADLFCRSCGAHVRRPLEVVT